MIFDRICQKWNFRQKRREKVEADDVIDVFGGIYVGLGTARVQGPALMGLKHFGSLFIRGSIISGLPPLSNTSFFDYPQIFSSIDPAQYSRTLHLCHLEAQVILPESHLSE